MAGIVFQTSFDHFTTVTHRCTSTVGTAPTISSGNGRNSTSSLRMTNQRSMARRTLPAALTDIWLGVAFRTSDAAQDRTLIAFGDNGQVQCAMLRGDDGTLRVSRGTIATALMNAPNPDPANFTTLGVVSGFSLLPNTFYHIEVYLRISNTVGLVKVWINEVERLNLTNQDTQVTANSYVTEFGLGSYSGSSGAPGATLDFDDLIVRDDQQVGDQQVRCFFPTGIGATNQWTATGAATTREAVDEAAPNEDTDYIEEATVGETSLFTYDSIPTTSTITAVIPLPRAKKTDAGTAKIKSAIRLSSTTYLGAENGPSDGAYEYQPDINMVSPDTGVAFTPAEWNAPIEIGPNRSA